MNNNNNELIPCENCNNMIPFNEYLSHLESHQTLNTNSNNNNNNNNPTNSNNNQTMIPCEFPNCIQKLILASEYNDHIQLHQLQNAELFNINSNSNNNNNNNNNNNINPFEFKQNNISYNNSISDVAFWLTKSPFINNKQFTLSLNDIINCSSCSTSIISKCIFFNYMIDTNFLFNTCQILKNKTKVENIYFFHGSEITQNELNQINNLSLNIIIKKIKIKWNIKYGTHHTKMIIIIYKNEGIRIVITTANIIQTDWLFKTNGIYLQDFPLKTNTKNNNKCDFEQVLKTYLDSLYEIDNNKIMDFSFINKYDFSSAKCLLIPSIPGYHKYKYINYYGHMRLRNLLNKYINISNIENNNSLISCVSSLGSLNEKYINQLCNSMKNEIKTFKLIWPNVNDIKNCIEGYVAGGSVCFSNKNYLKMKWLNKYFYKWNGNISNRMKLIPHIKCYCNINNKKKILNYFILTSANLSKAAWGDLQKNNSQLFIRSYEMGCLFIKEYYINNYLKHKYKSFCLNDLPYMKRNLLNDNEEKKEDNNVYDNCEFEVVYEENKNKKNDKNIIFPIPMEVFNVKKYDKNDKPWVWDLQYNEKDCHGSTWPPLFQ